MLIEIWLKLLTASLTNSLFCEILENLFKRILSCIYLSTNWIGSIKVMLEVVINRCDSDGVSPSVSLQSLSQGQSCTWNFPSAETKKQKVLNWWFSSILRLETFTGNEKNSVKVSNFFSIHNFNMIKTQTDWIIVWTLHWQNTV